MEIVKRILACLLLLLLVPCLTACGGDKAKEVDMNALAEELLQSGAFLSDMSQYQVSGSAAAMTFGFGEGATVSCSMYFNSAEGETILLAQAAEGGAESLKELCQTWVDNQKASLQDYRPEAIPRLDSAILESAGDYVILVTANDASAARTVVDKYFK